MYIEGLGFGLFWDNGKGNGNYNLEYFRNFKIPSSRSAIEALPTFELPVAW